MDCASPHALDVSSRGNRGILMGVCRLLNSATTGHCQSVPTAGVPAACVASAWHNIKLCRTTK